MTVVSDRAAFYRINPAWRDLAGEVTHGAGTRPARVIRSPIDGAELGSVPVCSPADVELAARPARGAGRRWAAGAPVRRRGVVERCKEQ
ncbi:MAG: hypothetical protein LBD70_05760, partial [Bifidobacteriaceae bacterium]|nr:hypothetical protein [Bifidobacteriaceae bacterium]